MTIPGAREEYQEDKTKKRRQQMQKSLKRFDATAAQVKEALAEAVGGVPAAAAAAAAASTEELTSERKRQEDNDEQILGLILERKATNKEDKKHIREVSKNIKKYIRDQKTAERQEKCKNSGRSERHGEHPKHQVCKETNSHAESQKKE